ncbi:DUF5320 family protein [Desulfofustis glycolicus]|uniref:DUF5320 domain-containing protein n=1 Tax=Desulfofustis glycolicus DSM 9705 TaxID=1121409 RepID=A0A1M5SAC9_9BACT|nr:DUF5320 family protein [Desulfofustis glycolicus]MCB2216186.1 DUF5320 family protein [Desulfobulbaceae bacterium]SHH35449.1 hypothetical protein SAMN02745124_00243 [Desulfofustis glycolicus DSM 9705]
MPGFDRTGPMGGGPMTGGGFGRCAGGDRAGMYYGCGFGRGRGFGRGFGRNVPVAVPGARMAAPEDELEYLTSEAQRLEQHLQTINRQIEDLKHKTE